MGAHGHRDSRAHADHGSTVHGRSDHAPGDEAHADEAHAEGSHTHAHGGAGASPWWRALGSVVLPHHHGAHGSDRALESTAAGMRAVGISLAGLGVTAAVQLAVALVSHSSALLADTIHNFADALTAVPLAIAFRLGRRPATRRYTFGFGRAEDVAGLVILGVIAASTVLAALTSVDHLVHPRGIRGPGWVIAAGAVGVVGNELVASYRIRVGRRIGSDALVADGLHARSDGLTSLAVVVGAVFVVGGVHAADPVAGIAISAANVVVLMGAVRTIYRRLMDSVDPALVDQVEAVVRAVPGVDGLDAVRVRWVGHELWAEIEVVSDPALSLVASHAIAAEAHHRLLHEVPRLAEAVIHTSPGGDDASRYHAVLSHHFRSADGYTPAPVSTQGATTPADAVTVSEVTVADDEMVDALRGLVPELSSSAPPLSRADVERIVDSPATVLLVARDHRGTVVGSLTLVVFHAPTGPRAWIEDVVVAPRARGAGAGAALVTHALQRAQDAGARTVDLTSRPSREAANRLYVRLGFERRQTNVYRRTLE